MVRKVRRMDDGRGGNGKGGVRRKALGEGYEGRGKE